MILVILLLWGLFAALGYNLGKERTIGAIGGLVLGLLLGLIGVIIVLFFSKVETEINHDLIIQESYHNQRREFQHTNHEAKITAVDQLKKWHELFELGAITKEEFEIKKKELIK